MKKLITTDLGGQPVYFKDFEFLQEMIRELANCTMNNLSDGTTSVTVLNGATFDLSTDGYTLDVLTDGWAFYLGEFYYIPVHSATGSGTDVPKWNIVESNDSRGLKTFHDSGVGDKDVYLVRQLQVSYVPPASGGSYYSSTKGINLETSWSAVSPQSPWTGQFKYRINNGGDLEMNGQLSNAGAATVHGGVVYVFPEEYRPKIDLRMPVTTIVGSGFSGELYLKTNGELIFYSQTYTTALSLFLSNKFMLQAP